MKVGQQTPAAVICYTKTNEELKHLNTSTYQDVKFYHLISGLSSKKRTQAVAKILAKIRKLNIHNLVFYVDQEDLEEFFTLGEMMQMTGSKYRWILPRRSKPSGVYLPVNTLLLQPKNSTKLQNIFDDAIHLINQTFRSFIKHYEDVPHMRCFDKLNSSFGEKFHRFIKLFFYTYVYLYLDISKTQQPQEK
jgi:hypothetical protein